MAAIYHLLDERESFSEHNGGAISRWAANVLREGTEIVACPSSDTSWRFPSERVYHLPEWSIVAPTHPLLYRSPWLVQKLVYTRLFRRSLLKQFRAGDIVYVHNRPEYAAVLSTLAKTYGIQVFLHMHNSLLLRANRGQLNALKKTPIVFCSEFLRREAHAALPNHFESTYLVYNGADTRKFHAIEREDRAVPTIIFTGRLVPYKGVHVLMQAMRILESKGIAAQCKIVGSAGFGGAKPSRYVRRLHGLRSANTELLGYIVGDQLGEMLRQADIFCCPSIWNDPFPLAPLEAMASGLPVVASNAGGLKEMFANGGGILVEPNNAGMLANAIGRLILNPAYRAQLGREALQAFHKNFLWSSVRQQYEQALRGETA